MDRQVTRRIKTAMFLEEKAKRAVSIKYRPTNNQLPSYVKDAVTLQLEAARQYQHAYRIPVEQGFTFGSNRVYDAEYEEMSFLASCVRMSSHYLIHTGVQVDLAEQLATGAEGLSLLGCSDPELFFAGPHKLNAVYGRTLDHVCSLNASRGTRCLEVFEEQCQELTVGRDVRRHFRDYIAAESARAEGRPLRPTRFNEVMLTTEARPY